MRKLIMWNLVTLDGFFEGENNWDLAFHELVWGKELEQISTEQLRSAEICLCSAKSCITGYGSVLVQRVREIHDILSAGF
jgi:hypothetical protein